MQKNEELRFKIWYSFFRNSLVKRLNSPHVFVENNRFRISTLAMRFNNY